MMVQSLHWNAFDLLTFDRETALGVVGELVSKASQAKRQELLDEIERQLISHFGPWISGWQWSAGEGGGGGPLSVWCCDQHSMFQPGEGPEATVRRVVDAVEEWSALVRELKTLFDSILAECLELPIDRHVERAAARLLPLVLERTSGHDAWYSTLATFLHWYLESASLDPCRQEVVRVISGRFESWLEPDPATVAATLTELGEVCARPLERDELAEWLLLRDGAFENFRERVCKQTGPDGHRLFIEGPERERDAPRALRMANALEACRRDAREGLPLTPHRLVQWQSLVLGRSVELRTTNAYANLGRSLYGIPKDFWELLQRCLSDATGPEPTAVRAARLYLDICYLHPFPDGNARLARLALDYVLTRDGRSLVSAEALFSLARTGADKTGALRLASALDYLCQKVPGAVL